jgi:predicted negative regulator of RcsB-dependent stress response
MRAELYPESYQALVFLGDRWAHRGDVERARALYEQALAKSPDTAAIQEKLDALKGSPTAPASSSPSR